VPHGIAVNIGMIFANALSMGRGFLKEDVFLKATNDLQLCNVPLKLRQEHFDHDTLLSCMKKDKKRVGRNLTVIIPDSEFRLQKVDNVTDKEFSATLDYMKDFLFQQEMR
jgi:3-dehydroquinate synthase